jgi:hypothetical protein
MAGPPGGPVTVSARGRQAVQKIALGLVFLSLLGCAGRSPLRDSDPSRLDYPLAHRIEQVPVYRQAPMECGPAALRMVLNYYGRRLTDQDVREARRGKLTSVYAMESFAKSLGFGFYRFYAGRKEKMKFFISKGYPLIALGVQPRNWVAGETYTGEGHYVVVIGYDDLRRIFHVIDPSGGRILEIPYTIFDNFHASHPTEADYVLCIYPVRS